MKSLLYLFLCLSASAQTINIYQGYPLLVGQYAATDLTNVVEVTTNNYGYQFNTNSTAKIAWQFPAQIVTGTNQIISLYQYSTNDNIISYLITTSFYNYTNGLIFTTNNTISSQVSSNYSFYVFTNSWTTNLIRTNYSFGTVVIQHVSNNIVTGNSWLLGGRIVFKN